MNETRNERLALAACAILVACDYSAPLRTAEDREVVKRGRDRADQMLQATGITPTELKALGLRICDEPA